MKVLIEKLRAGIDLSPEDITYSVAVLLSPTASSELKAQFLTALRKLPDLHDNSSIVRSILAWTRQSFPGRWLTSAAQAGMVSIFSMFLPRSCLCWPPVERL
jgi:hypothetical protein